ncbi:R3H domain-containing protein 4-like [Oppia nitens]|uniref:R3H domain-containing protein 4-like n=1 Tax=Oppia nitens TaxID=1686743 RepID=UPI0023DB8421|nr:R3H domain-containing protein 4-like [Oppia nitens]
MGVIRNFSSNLTTNSYDVDIIEEMIDNVIDDNDSDVDHNDLRAQRRSQRNRENRLRRNRLRPEPTFRALGVRGKSHRKNRRYADFNLLHQQMADSLTEGDELNDISIYDFIPQTVSAFAQILINGENMKILNDFINCTEEQQNEILNKRRDKTEGDKPNDSQTKVDINGKLDGRYYEPAFTADQCFQRIDSDLKNMLKKKRIPLGVLASIEEEITEFFNHKPFATYKSCLSSGFRRLLLHACCQYLDLKCFSFDADGERWSQVDNKNKYFYRPEVMLTEFIETKFAYF